MIATEIDHAADATACQPAACRMGLTGAAAAACPALDSIDREAQS